MAGDTEPQLVTDAVVRMLYVRREEQQLRPRRHAAGMRASSEPGRCVMVLQDTKSNAFMSSGYAYGLPWATRID